MKLRELRTQKLLTQQDLANLAGVSVTTIQSMEQGRHLPLFRTARRIAEALAVEPLEIDEVAEAMQRIQEGKEEASLVSA